MLLTQQNSAGDFHTSHHLHAWWGLTHKLKFRRLFLSFTQNIWIYLKILKRVKEFPIKKKNLPSNKVFPALVVQDVYWRHHFAIQHTLNSGVFCAKAPRLDGARSVCSLQGASGAVQGMRPKAMSHWLPESFINGLIKHSLKLSVAVIQFTFKIFFPCASIAEEFS